MAGRPLTGEPVPLASGSVGTSRQAVVAARRKLAIPRAEALTDIGSSRSSPRH